MNYYSDSKAFLEKAPQVAQLSKKYGIPVGSTGRWGATRLDEKGNIIEKALQEDKDIIEAASIMGCPSSTLAVTGRRDCPTTTTASGPLNISESFSTLPDRRA